MNSMRSRLSLLGCLWVAAWVAASCAGGGAPADAGTDAGVDAGQDADGAADGDASPDSGPDGGRDAGRDAGPDGETDAGADPGPCRGMPGTYRDQRFSIDGEERAYYLYVPAGYDCAVPAALLVDLHGTAGDYPEEAYGLSDALATADRRGFILLRPRSRSSLEGGQRVYRWDQNRGDPERNRRFILALVSELKTRYNLDPGRLYLMGFSSGTNQTAVLMADPESPFVGYGFVGGGSWTVSSVPRTSARAALVTGFRDYMWAYHDNLVNLLAAASFPAEQIWVRETDAGHELYGWMYPEIWDFLDGGLRPDPGALRAGWTTEDVGTTEPLLAFTTLADGSLLAAGGHAGLWRRDPDGRWSPVEVTGQPAFPRRAWTSLCLTGDGFGLLVGGGAAAVSLDGGARWTQRPVIPEIGEPMMGYSHLNGVACAAARLVGTAYWSGAATEDRGQTFTDVSFMASYGMRAQGAAIQRASWGTWMAAGYWAYLARSTDGATFAPASFSPIADWLYDVAPAARGVWAAVGDGGGIWRSADDGRSFSRVSGGSGAELYAAAFDASGERGLAVGRAGAAWLSEDGGKSWRDCRAGVDRFLGAVAWLPDGTALVGGEGGMALRFDPAGCGTGKDVLASDPPSDAAGTSRRAPPARMLFDGPAALLR